MNSHKRVKKISVFYFKELKKNPSNFSIKKAQEGRRKLSNFNKEGAGGEGEIVKRIVVNSDKIVSFNCSILSERTTKEKKNKKKMVIKK